LTKNPDLVSRKIVPILVFVLVPIDFENAMEP
jgi:hypothetical protein